MTWKRSTGYALSPPDAPGDASRIGPGALARDVDIGAGMVLGVVADPEDLDHFVDAFGLKKRNG